jgi:hypothetical protein
MLMVQTIAMSSCVRLEKKINCSRTSSKFPLFYKLQTAIVRHLHFA